tara:strand:- start:4528 stop:7020 length:2493 start_codon:yes stop_codon:yes gene_type:complete
MEKEYVVVVKAGVDLAAFDAELAATTGEGPIPSRSVNIANPRIGSKRMTHWMLTPSEAQQLYKDPRVLSIEIPIDQRDDVQIIKKAYQTADFDKPTVLVNNNVNWGLRRCIEETNIYNNSRTIDGQYQYAFDGTGVDIVIQDSGLEVDHPEFIISDYIAPELYFSGEVIDLVGNGSDFFKREVTVHGVRIVAAGTVGGQTAVPDAWLEKVARMFELFTDPTGAGINETAQSNLIKTLKGDAGTYHAAQGPTLQRVARGAGSDYTPNFLDDAGIAFWNLSPLFDSHAANDMVWYLNSTGDGYGVGDTDAQEVIEHVFHTLHMHGLDATALKMYPTISADWNTSDLFLAMDEAVTASKFDPSGYAPNWKSDVEQFPLAVKEYLYLLNFGMFEYSDLWTGGSLAPEWTDDMRTQPGIKTNNPLGYALFNTYIAPVISKPTLATIRKIFQNGNTPSQDNPALAGSSSYISDSSLRVKQIDWYAASGIAGTQNANHYIDTDGHGTHCAGIAAGKTFGWAKNAHVYSQKLQGLEGTGDSGTGISIADSFDAIRLWHAAKSNGRPTVVNMSWGYATSLSSDPTGGTYRGTAWTWGVDYSNDIDLWTATGIPPRQNGVVRSIPLRITSVDVEIDDMVAAGIHVVIAAGNDYYKGDIVGGDDYDNTVVFGASTLNYHRGSSPHSNDAFIIGNVDDDTQVDSGVYKDKTAPSSSRGPRLDTFAPGTNITSTCSTSSIYGTLPYPSNGSYNIAMISGTSMAAPQVCGVIAQHLQVNPNLTPAQIKTRINSDAKATMFTTGADNDYFVFGTSLMGSPNRMLYSKYGIQPLTGNKDVTSFNVT